MRKILFAGVMLGILMACNEQTIEQESELNLKAGKVHGQQPINFSLLSSIDIGEEAAAEISAYDPLTMKLYVVDNSGTSQIVVVDLSNPSIPNPVGNIDVSGIGGGVNSVAVNNGLLAAAIEAFNKTDNGTVAVFNTLDHSLVTSVTVGALPDMVTFSPDGKYILSANEGEPNSDYSVDPEGTVSIIDIDNEFAETRLTFDAFEPQKEILMKKGLRIFGPDSSFTSNLEPEYIAVAQNSKIAWVSLQENNALAVINLNSKSITEILPLGFKNYNISANAIDANDKDAEYVPQELPVFGIYEPDAVAVFSQNNVPFVFTANEGDAREYDTFVEEVRVKDVELDTTVFPNAEELQKNDMLGRLNITNTLGNVDGVYTALYSFGGRSFSIWNGNTGKQIFDSGNELDHYADMNGSYDDGRSDNKSVEPEGLVTGHIGNTELLFVGMERADAVAVYDITNPVKPRYLQWLTAGDAPEGLIFVSAEESPNGKPLLIISSEGDGVVSIFSVADVI